MNTYMTTPFLASLTYINMERLSASVTAPVALVVLCVDVWSSAVMFSFCGVLFSRVLKIRQPLSISVVIVALPTVDPYASSMGVSFIRKTGKCQFMGKISYRKPNNLGVLVMVVSACACPRTSSPSSLAAPLKLPASSSRSTSPSTVIQKRVLAKLDHRSSC